MINHETVKEAVRSLLKWRQSLPPQEDEFLHLLLYLNEIPHTDADQIYHIPLPHRLLRKSPNLCLIIDDTHVDDAHNKIKSENLPVSKVLNLSNLKSDYRTSEARRELCDCYDLFLAEESVIPRLTRILGTKKKAPVPLDLKDRDWKAQIERAFSCTSLCLNSWNCYEVRVAEVLLMTKVEIVENVIAACNGIADVIPGNWGNIRSLHLRLFGSHQLRIYRSVPISTISERIGIITVRKAVRDLLNWRKSKSSSDEEDGFLYLDLYLKEIPHPDNLRDYVIVLRHSILSESPKLCLIVDDSHDEEEGFTKEEAEEKIKSENLQISNVLKLSELKSDYPSSEAKRELCDCYDEFLAEESIIPRLIGILEKKEPLWFDFTDGNWERQIERACCSTSLCLSNGTYYEARVAQVSMEMYEIVENVLSAIIGISCIVPNHWGNIASLHLRLLGSHQLPIYQDS